MKAMWLDSIPDASDVDLHVEVAITTAIRRTDGGPLKPGFRQLGYGSRDIDSICLDPRRRRRDQVLNCYVPAAETTT
jgi:hypothetical protein